MKYFLLALLSWSLLAQNGSEAYYFYVLPYDNITIDECKIKNKEVLMTFRLQHRNRGAKEEFYSTSMPQESGTPCPSNIKELLLELDHRKTPLVLGTLSREEFEAMSEEELSELSIRFSFLNSLYMSKEISRLDHDEIYLEIVTPN